MACLLVWPVSRCLFHCHNLFFMVLVNKNSFSLDRIFIKHLNNTITKYIENFVRLKCFFLRVSPQPYLLKFYFPTRARNFFLVSLFSFTNELRVRILGMDFIW